MNYLKKVYSSLKRNGFRRTLGAVYDKINFESKCKMVALKLNVQKSLRGNELIVDHGKYKFKFYGGGDRGEILYHAFWNKMFDDELFKIKDYVKSGDSVIDVGGNMGFFALILNEIVGESGKIYSFEPSEQLCKKLTSTVEIINIALGDKEGTSSLYYNPKQSGLSSMVTHDENNSLVEEIKITTIDKFSQKISDRISFIKIDTEGFEPQVLRGAQETIKKYKPVIYIELGGDHLESSIEALKVLKEFGYNCEADNIDLKTTLAGVNFIATPILK